MGRDGGELVFYERRRGFTNKAGFLEVEDEGQAGGGLKAQRGGKRMEIGWEWGKGW